MQPRQRLSDILRNADREKLAAAWDATKAAGELGPLPTGDYTCRILKGELGVSNSGKPSYKLTLEVAEGEHAKRRCWHDIWLTEAALSMAKRDLAKIGVPVDGFEAMLSHLERPIPSGILLRVRLALRKTDDDREYNRVVRFEAAGTEPGDAYAPADEDLPAGATEFDPAGFEGEQVPTSATPTRSLPLPGNNGCSGPYAEGR
jgi:hypothetical protein